jgi:hypothetical protein
LAANGAAGGWINHAVRDGSDIPVALWLLTSAARIFPSSTPSNHLVFCLLFADAWRAKFSLVLSYQKDRINLK